MLNIKWFEVIYNFSDESLDIEYKSLLIENIRKYINDIMEKLGRQEVRATSQLNAWYMTRMTESGKALYWPPWYKLILVNLLPDIF